LQPIIYTATEHRIKPSQIDKDALYVMAKLIQNGYVAYLVGGGVRDALMGKTPKDFDIVTSAKPEEIKRLFSNCLLIGRRFRLAHIRFGKKIIEVSTFRSGDINDSELILRDNSFGTPEEDVLRRDFTINGLFYDPKDHLVIDYVGGFEDLSKHLLKTIGNPTVRFRQDPVRMIRLLKFKARFNFNICKEALLALESCKEDILKSSPARLLEEFLRMLESGASLPFLELMQQNDFLKLLLPKLSVNDEIRPYLKALDQFIIQDKTHLPERAILISLLAFPLIKEKITDHTYQEIIQITEETLHALFASSFMPFPKRIRSLSSFILNTQFRLTPPNQKKPQKYRLIRHPDFLLTLDFLRLRTYVDPSLKEIYHIWKQKKSPKKERAQKEST
jgi:poly(A) polymerase